MNSMDLLELIGEAKDTYLLEAQSHRSGHMEERKLKRNMRPLVIAALIALMILMMGCAVVWMSLQDMKIGEYNTTQHFDESGRKIDPVEVTMDVISLHGYGDNPVQLAAKAWYEFEKSYDTDGALLAANDSTRFSSDYDAYGCYTWEMVDEVDKIAKEYGLKLLGKQTIVQTWQNQIMFDALGIEGLCNSDADTEVKYLSGYFYPEGTFKMTVDFTLEGWHDVIWSNMYYAKKDYFDPGYTIVDINAYEQWNYTTEEGTRLLLAWKDSAAIIFTETEDAVITILLDTNTKTVHPDKSQLPSKQVIERAAEIFDYAIQPHAVEDMAAVETKLAEAQKEYEAKQQVPAEEYHSYGEYLVNQFWIEDLYYMFMDINGDGTEEMLLGYEDGSFDRIVSMENGTVTEQLWDICRLCDGGFIAYVDTSETSSFERYSYFKMVNGQQEFAESVEYRDGNWKKCSGADQAYTETSISAAEADAVRSKYTYLELEWKCALGYPMDDQGTVLADVLREQEVQLSESDMLAIFAEYVATHRSVYPRRYYTFRDINGDGVKELLLSPDEDGFSEIIVLYRGRAHLLYQKESYLCENNVIACVTESHDYYDGWCDDYSYRKLNGKTWEQLDFVRYSVGTDTWRQNEDGSEMTAEEASAILTKYIRIDLNMKPISELLDEYKQ